MQIITASSAFPKHYYPQAVVLEALERYWGAELENPELLHRLHRNTGVNGRHFALPLHAYPKLSRWSEMNDLWIEVALDLAPRDLGAFFFTSVTGIASPSIDALLINRIGLSPNICRVPMFGLSCVAGAAGIARASDYVKAYPAQLAVLLSVELCSLTIQKEDLSPANLISCGLFGDGRPPLSWRGTSAAHSRQPRSSSAPKFWRRARCFIPGPKR
jgi:alkylresorcinol/alkylpyrone synthase